MRVFRKAVKVVPVTEVGPITRVWTPVGGGVLVPLPEGVKEVAGALLNEVEGLIEKHRKAVLPAALQAEIKALRSFLDEASALYQRIREYEIAEPTITVVKEFITARDRILKHMQSLRERIARKEQYLLKKGKVREVAVTATTKS
ncbi:hypothetical protein [Desulfurococcus sp.]|uniref:hypothetical protein n=1 Tax=Desulfurococcus sp. TaxID=51678 RepID=UPI003171DC39